MAGADYYSCDVCGCKTFYDSNVDWECQHPLRIRCICGDCDKTHEIKIVNVATGAEVKPDGGGSYVDEVMRAKAARETVG